MATSMASDKPSLIFAQEDAPADPFVSPPGANHRYSGFDSHMFSLGPGASPTSAKRALEAHLADTERRMEEAGKLGTALVQQRKELTERLKEVELVEAEGELSPELKEKLTNIEKDFNEVARESARAFLPKQRVPSNEANAGSPHVPEAGRSAARRSISPSKFESMATGSPSKFSVPNRKLRNQPANRIHDIEFAAEISTSLITQVRNLQALLQQREEDLKDLKADKSRLEVEVEGFQQRMKNLDESENRYKDENWNLETQIQELVTSQKVAADREKKLTHTLNTLQADKNSTQRELDEIKVAHSKLVEDHAAAVKHLDIELGTAKRNAVMAESEHSAMQRKIDELTGQNQELVRAIALQRGRLSDREPAEGQSDDDFENDAGNMTPDHSPPPSPIKPTPRHSMLESETLKTSLQHAQRTIQSLRTNVHKEKTEKLELKRMLQDARDEIEKLRSEPPERPQHKRAREAKSREFKKPPRLSQLGTVRAVRAEIIDDPEWEDEGATATPGRSPASVHTARMPDILPSVETNDEFETANEAFETANEANDGTDTFETANERATETDDFQTGIEDFSDSDEVETETESPTKRARISQHPTIFAINQPGNRFSFQSTASTSADEYDYGERSPRSPASPPQRMRLRVSRGAISRRSRQLSEEPNLQSSPIGQPNTSFEGAPHQQSLFAELGELEGSDDDSPTATPSRRSTRSMTPSTARGRTASPLPLPAVPALPKVVMMDAGVMTDPVVVQSLSTPISGRMGSAGRPMSTNSVISAIRDGDSRPMSTFSYSDAGVQNDPDMGEKLARFPSPTSPPVIGAIPTPALPPPQQRLSMSTIQSEVVEPEAEFESAPPWQPTLGLSGMVFEHVEPVAERRMQPSQLRMSYVLSEHVEPIAEPRQPYSPPPALSVSSINAEHVEPVAEPKQALPPAPTLTFSSILTEQVEPNAEPEREPQTVRVIERIEASKPLPPTLGFSSVLSEGIEPKAEPQAPQLPLSLSSITSEVVQPIEEARRLPPPLSMSSILAEDVVPKAESEVIPPPLSLSTIVSEGIEPRTEATLLSPLSLSPLVYEHVEPVKSVPSPLNFAAVQSVETEPVEPIFPQRLVPAPLRFSPVRSIDLEALETRSPKRQGFIIPRDEEEHGDLDASAPRTPRRSGLASALGWGKGKEPATPTIAEDETRQSPRSTPLAETPESQRPFKEISANTSTKPIRKQPIPTTDQSAQTSLTAEAIDEILLAKSRQGTVGHQRSESAASVSSIGTPGTVRIRRSHDSINSVIIRSKGKVVDAGNDTAQEAAPLRRPGSAASTRASLQNVPPLPSNHKEVIEAARSGTASSGQGTMGPPLYPASAYKNPVYRPKTPSAMSITSSTKGTPTPRAEKAGSAHGTAEVHSPSRITERSRKSSVSSFASEVDARFNIHNGMGTDPHGFGASTDPRMIQAITQTMIGEYLWKYTRKAGRGEMSENRHRRYFWVHPYTRTLYWSDRDPSSAGRVELRAKSVPIEAVRVVTDDNPMPPGLHRKSLIVISPGRSVKFTCTTGQRHETWFNALSYLLLRTNAENQADTEEMAGGITRDDVDEFNPSYGRRPPAGTRPRPPPSLSSYNSRTSRTTRADSPAPGVSLNVPTLTPSHKRSSTPRPSLGGRLSGYWKSTQGTFSSLRSRNGVFQDQQSSIYEPSQVHDSAEDLRMLYEKQDRESDRLENVRACCEGRHDVGTLTRKKGQRLSHNYSNSHDHLHSHSHPGPSTTPTSLGTVRSRA